MWVEVDVSDDWMVKKIVYYINYKVLFMVLVGDCDVVVGVVSFWFGDCI